MNTVLKKMRLACLLLFVALDLHAVDDANSILTFIAANASDITAQTTATNNLSHYFGTLRKKEAQTLTTTLQNAITATNTKLTDTDSAVLDTVQNSVTLRAQLQAQVALYTILVNRCADADTLGTLQNSLSSLISTLAAALDTTSSVTTITNAINTAAASAIGGGSGLKTNMDSYNTAGFGPQNTFKTTEEWGYFQAEYARAENLEEVATGLLVFRTDYADLVGSLNAVPASDDDTIVDYDTAYLAAQNAIDADAQTVLYDLNIILGYATLIANADLAPSDQIDCVASVANTLVVKLNQFKNYISSFRAKVAVARKEVAARILERQLLFDAVTFAEKRTFAASIGALLTTQSTAADTLNTAVAATAGLLSAGTPSFSPVPDAPAGQGQRSNMGVAIDAQVAAFNANLLVTIRKLFTGAPPQATIDAILNTLRPAIYLQQTGGVMGQWLTSRMAVLNADSLPVGKTLSELLAAYNVEWQEFLAILANILTSPLISDGARAAVAQAQSNAAFTGLFTGTTTAQIFTTKASILTKIPIGAIRQIITQGDIEFQRIILSLLGQMQTGSLTGPASVLTNAADIAAQTLAVPQSPTTTVNNTSTLTSQIADGSTLLVTGSGSIAARLRDPVFNSNVTNKLSASLKIFLNNSARIGLGTANISNSPGQTPNVLGGSDAQQQNSVQVVPDGNGFIDVNSDLIIGGSKPIVPTAQFGTEIHTLTFYSEVERTITVLANTTWDLSDFGTTGTAYQDYGKRIVFGGKVKVVLEPGAKIRFPLVDPARTRQTVVLYFTDKAQLICQGNPLYIGKPWNGGVVTGTDCQRSKIMGMGAIWFDKDAQMVVNKSALFGIEADYTTPKTDITFSLEGAAQITIGSSTVAGGAFQVGNMFYGGSKEHPHNTNPDTHFPNSTINPLYQAQQNPFTPHQTTIDFTLRLNSPSAKFVIGKQGFLGLAAGIINKDGAPNTSTAGPNGDPNITNTAWQLQRLYNVSNITLDIAQGTFDHSIIATGTNNACSMLAISKLANAYPNSKYLLRLGPPEKAIVRGGGNLYFIDKNASMTLNAQGSVTALPHTVLINDMSYDLSFVLPNNGVCAPLAPTPSIMNRGVTIPGISAYILHGRGVITKSTDTPYAFAGPSEEFFAALRLTQYNDIVEKYVPLSMYTNEALITYVNNQTIMRVPLSAINLRNGAIEDALGQGYVRGEKQINGVPTRFSMPTLA